MREWLHQEHQTAEEQFEHYRQEWLAGGDQWQQNKSQRDYWHGYLEAITNAINELEGMN